MLIGRGAVLHADFPRRALANPEFTAVRRPVTRAYLREQGLGPGFIEYLAEMSSLVILRVRFQVSDFVATAGGYPLAVAEQANVARADSSQP